MERLRAHAANRWDRRDVTLPPTADSSATRQRITDTLRRHAGHHVDDAIPAFSGLYPLHNGYGNWELFFTRARIISRTGTRLAVWSAYTGEVPAKQLSSDALSALVLEVGPQDEPARRYGRVAIGAKHYWVSADFWAVLQGWLSDNLMQS